MPATIDDRVAELEKANAELSQKLDACTAELKAARERQQAANAVLEAMSRSPGDMRPVFEAIVESATRLCHAEFTAVARFEGGLLHLVAINNLSPEEGAAFHRLFPRPPLRDFAMGRSFLDGEPVQFADVLAEPGYDTRTREVLQSVIQYRSFLGVPILREGRPIGVIGCGRREVRPVAEAEIAILQTFADQAAIALENTRLLGETREALDQQTATAEVLQVINSSPGDLAPVFDAMLDKALHLCQAKIGTLWIYDGQSMHASAVRGAPPPYAEFLSRGPHPPSPIAHRHLLGGEPAVHIADITETAGYRSGDRLPRAVADLGGVRTLLAVPLRKDEALLGVFSIYRQEVRPFTEKQIALLQNFAAQAVIAMENARLLTETREALEQQTATAEVLQVINSSPGDLAPVFDAMLDKATGLCEAVFGILYMFNGERLLPTRWRGVPTGFAEFVAESAMVPGPGTAAYRFRHGERSVIQTLDLADEEPYRAGDPLRRSLVDLGGARSALHVALVKDDNVLGVITIYRQEVRPFTDKQIALLQNFAAQAVIAMENARLLTETREALAQQTATAEVLGIINSSPGDLAPVFDAMLEKAMRLCEASHGHVWRFDGEQLHAVAARGDSSFIEWLREHSPVRPIPGSAADRIARGERLVHLADRREEDAYQDDPVFRGLVDTSGVRASLSVALRRDETLLGMINVYRQEVRPFTEKQIALLQNFAAQAVIAMENARLIIETREALEQQTATAEVLQVINSSPGDLAPVFEAMLEKATRLCGASLGTLWAYDGERMHPVAMRGASGAYARYLSREPLRPGAGALGSFVRGETILHVVDLKDTEAYRSGDRHRRALVDLGGGRCLLGVPLRTDDQLRGAFLIYRQEPQPFTDKQIVLLQNFAAQAVIAMENARLITETREALAQQTATAEVLQVINSSPGELAPVFDAMLEKAMALCEAAFGGLWTFDGDRYVATALRGVPDEYARFLAQTTLLPGPGSAPYRFLHGERAVIQNLDLAGEEPYRAGDPQRRALVDLGGARTALQAPLVKDDLVLGVITIYRQQVRTFTDKQISLLQNFAAQAVIAMENTRLITETREALEQQTATAEVLQVINSSPGDLAPVFDAMLDKATRLCNSDFGILLTYDGATFHTAALHNVPAAYADFMMRAPPQPSPENAISRILQGERVVVIEDVTRERAYFAGDGRRRALVELAKGRSYLAVGLFKDDKLLGTLAAYRQEVRPFTEKEIALLQNFAAQAVIAMENARLINETREALEQQTATAEVLQVINSSPGDLAPVFEAMLHKAHTLCEASFGALMTYDGERFHAVAHQGTPALFREFLAAGIRPGSGDPFVRMVGGSALSHIHDLSEVAAQHPDEALPRAAVDLGGIRTLLVVPLRKDNALLGAITAYRREVRPFTDKQIALLQNFAAQAVIAMENARLLTETREALEQQTATAEILGVINASPGDLAPVFAAILDKAHTLCGATLGSLFLFDGELFRATATQGYPQDLAERLRQGVVLSATARLLDNSIRWVQNPDLTLLDAPTARAVSGRGGVRTNLMLPLRKDGRLLGAISCNRREVRPFADKEIALLESFAAQAVIAMDNARLLDEIRQRQAELRTTFDNMGDGVAMFDAGLKLAAWNRNFQEMLDLPDEFVAARPSYAEYARYLAERGEFGPADVEAEVRRMAQVVGTRGSLERTRPDGRVVEVRYNPAPDGGFVLIYGDVTERKRAEAEIRAARDAAEKALGELKTAQASLVHAEKMASLGQLTAGIAHEIKNPLNFVNNFAGLSVELLEELKEAAAPAVASLGDDMRGEIDELVQTLSGNLGKIAEHGRRADGIVTSMLAHSRGSTGERQRTDLNALVEEALNLAYHGARAQDQDFNIATERAFEPGLAPIEIVPQDLTRVFLNLFGNGFYAARNRARETGDGFRPVLGVATRDLGDAVEIRVRDNGAGIPPELREKLFQPFFTTKPTGEGTGLGLSISYDIVTQGHGGAISVESEPGRFTEFTIRLPRRAHAI